MKTKAQKTEQLEEGKRLFDNSKVLIFTDFTKLPTGEMRELRKHLNEIGAKLFVLKKRLLNILMKERGLEFDARRYDFSVGTVFSPVEMDQAASPVYKFFKELKLENEKILGGYDLQAKQYVEAGEVIMLGQLPPREILLAQVLGMMVAPLRSFMYILDQKSKQH